MTLESGNISTQPVLYGYMWHNQPPLERRKGDRDSQVRCGKIVNPRRVRFERSHAGEMCRRDLSCPSRVGQHSRLGSKLPRNLGSNQSICEDIHTVRHSFRPVKRNTPASQLTKETDARGIPQVVHLPDCPCMPVSFRPAGNWRWPLTSDQRSVSHTRHRCPCSSWSRSGWPAAKRRRALGPQIVGTHLNANYEMGWALMRYQLHRLGLGLPRRHD